MGYTQILDRPLCHGQVGKVRLKTDEPTLETKGELGFGGVSH